MRTEEGSSSGEEKHLDGFSPYVQERLGYYVYLLSEPPDGRIFYVGKGKGNRVFSHAQGPSTMNMSLTSSTASATSEKLASKLDTSCCDSL